jgi:hypothetical protein
MAFYKFEMNRNEYGDGNAGASSEWCCIDANEREHYYAIG